MKEKLYRVIADYTPGNIGILPFMPSQKLNKERVQELHVSKDEFVNVIKKFPTGWWFAQYKGLLSKLVLLVLLSSTFSDQRGWIPATHLEEYTPLASSGYQSGSNLGEDKSNSESENRPLSSMNSFNDCLGEASFDILPGDIMVTTHDYQANRDDEVSFPSACLVQVKNSLISGLIHQKFKLIESSEQGWPLIRYNGRIGRAPAIFLSKFTGDFYLKVLDFVTMKLQLHNDKGTKGALESMMKCLIPTTL